MTFAFFRGRSHSIARFLIACWAGFLLLLPPGGAHAQWQAGSKEQKIERQLASHAGFGIFTREFKPAEDPDELTDGLGPVFNARSCVACHHQGGTGGGGDNRFNVDILTVIPPARAMDAAKQQQFTTRLTAIHPGFADSASVMLYREGSNPRFADWRERILGVKSDDPFKPLSQHNVRVRTKFIENQGPVVRLREFRGVRFLLTRRNSTSLWGAGLIDSIPDEAIEELAAQQAQIDDGIAGRVSRLLQPDGQTEKIGKFGWRGQTASLAEFVAGACVNEMGLQLVNMQQPVDPAIWPKPQPEPRPRKASPIGAAPREQEPLPADLSESDLRELTDFVRSIPAPQQRVPEDPDQLTQALLGRSHFQSTGCIRCHVPTLGDVQGIFSDLLLHDMGQSLEDPLGAPGATRSVTRSGPGYYGSSGTVFVRVTSPDAVRRWRTPPLWGVRDTAPYMHDGRAETLHDAILAHDGEALASARAYARLNRHNRQALVAYLNAIGQPDE